MEDNGILLRKNKLYLSKSGEIREMVLKEMHNAPYVGNSSYQKIVEAFRKKCYWPRMKNGVSEYIARCMECQKFKLEHRHPIGLSRPFPILEWKWDVVIMEFITRLPKTRLYHDEIMVVVDKLTK